ncbi:zinc knuckle CX2CX4HX4C containing protein [Tanacetum coccineum]
MWRLYQLEEVIVNQGLYYFNFKSQEGMNSVIENGPWMVENKPLFVRKWEPGLCMSKLDTSKVPLWVKIYDIPLEAWNVDGISRIASRIGVPIIMDKITTSICEKPFGRALYAKVLVEVDAAKGLIDTVEICYKSLGKSMMLNVDYAWRPLVCEHCKNFGHLSRFYSKGQSNLEKKVGGDESVKNYRAAGNVVNDQEGWQNVGYRRGNRNFVNNYQQRSVNGRGNMGYRDRGGINNKSRNNVVDIEVKESSAKYVPVKSNDNNMNVDECIVADEVVKSSSNVGVGMSNVKSNSNKESGNLEMKDKASDGTSKGSVFKDGVSVENRFDVLNEDIDVEVSDVWEEVRARITTACNSGLPIAEEEINKWPDDIVKLYKEKWKKRSYVEKSPAELKLIEVMESLHNRIVQLNENLHVNARANALRLVKETNDATGVKSNSNLYTKFYDQSCREDLIKVEELQWERRRAEVDLFMLAKRPLMDDFKEIWTDDMVEYFLERCEEIKNDEKNGHYADDSGFDDMEEVGEDVSGSANFVTQNEVSSDIDGSMAQMQGGLAAHPSNLQ